MPEELILQHCSPTLAGLKTGNMFSVSFDCNEDMVEEIRKINALLTQKGLRAIPLRRGNNGCLIYIYRPDHLRRDLKTPAAVEILRSKGYSVENTSKCLAELARRLEREGDFPHEIGLFLGYPPVDVYGFMNNPKREVKCTGYWKVYGDREEAEKRFAKFRKCTKVYRDEYRKGKPLEKLIVRSTDRELSQA